MERKKVHEPGGCPDSLYGLEVECDGYAKWQVNPYHADVNSVDIWEWLCPGVYMGCIMDI